MVTLWARVLKLVEGKKGKNHKHWILLENASVSYCSRGWDSQKAKPFLEYLSLSLWETLL